MKEITKRVEKILESDPSTRNSDHILYREYLRIYHPDLLNVKILSFLTKVTVKENQIAPIETVGRARRKIMERRSDLRADVNVEAMREINEQKFRDYARS